MLYGVSAIPLPVTFPFAASIAAAAGADFPPCWLGAVAATENGELLSVNPSAALTVISGDSGHGLYQITPEAWWPTPMRAAWSNLDWKSPTANATFARLWFLEPAVTYWNGTLLMTGDDLVKCVAAEYNAGRAAAQDGHEKGEVDAFTTGGDYGARTLANLHALLAGKLPW
jgi:hypothetical protein